MKLTAPWNATLAAAGVCLATLAPAGAQLAGQLGVLDLGANGGINPATGVGWAAGDTYRLVFLSSQTTDATSGDITTVTVTASEALETLFGRAGVVQN